MDLSAKSALVTGGAIRVGRAITLALAEAGARLIVHYHSSSEEADALVAEIRAAGGEAVALGGDLGDLDAVFRLADEAEAAFGGVDVLVNNASVFPPSSFGAVDAAEWEKTMAVNLRAPFFLSQRLGERMRERGEGVIVNMADLAGTQVWTGYAAHSVAKAGLVHLTRVSAKALAPEVRVNAIAPGTVLPPEDYPAEQVERIAATTPLRRNGTPEDVAQAVLYLVRADFVTGDVLVLDGGRSLRG